MTKRALAAAMGIVSVCSPLLAEQTYRADIATALNSSSFYVPSLTLSDPQLFSFLNPLETRTPDFLPPLLAMELPQRATARASATSLQDSSKEVVDVRRPLLDYAGGEVGFMFGVSTGKFGGTYEAGYITGGVGNDKFQINVGASYENWNGRGPRWGR